MVLLITMPCHSSLLKAILLWHHQSYMTQCHSLFALISYYAIVFSFILMFTDSWFTYWVMFFALPLFISWVIWNNKAINYWNLWPRTSGCPAWPHGCSRAHKRSPWNHHIIQKRRWRAFQRRYIWKAVWVRRLVLTYLFHGKRPYKSIEIILKVKLSRTTFGKIFTFLI